MKCNRVGENTYDPADQLKRSLQRVYNGANQLHKLLGASNQTTTYGYYRGNMNTVVDPLNRQTTSAYDALDRITGTTDPAGTTSFGYDAKDRLVSVRDPKLAPYNVATTYTYNGLGDLLTQVSPDTGTTTFTYDAAGTSPCRPMRAARRPRTATTP